MMVQSASLMALVDDAVEVRYVDNWREIPFEEAQTAFVTANYEH